MLSRPPISPGCSVSIIERHLDPTVWRERGLVVGPNNRIGTSVFAFHGPVKRSSLCTGQFDAHWAHNHQPCTGTARGLTASISPTKDGQSLTGMLAGPSRQEIEAELVRMLPIR